MENNSKIMELANKVKKSSKIAFVFMHIANCVFNIVYIPTTFMDSCSHTAVQQMQGSYERYDIYVSNPDTTIRGLVIGAFLLCANFFIIKFLKSATDLFIERNTME